MKNTRTKKKRKVRIKTLDGKIYTFMVDRDILILDFKKDIQK